MGSDAQFQGYIDFFDCRGSLEITDKTPSITKHFDVSRVTAKWFKGEKCRAATVNEWLTQTMDVKNYHPDSIRGNSRLAEKLECDLSNVRVTITYPKQGEFMLETMKDVSIIYQITGTIVEREVKSPSPPKTPSYSPDYKGIPVSDDFPSPVGGPVGCPYQFRSPSYSPTKPSYSRTDRMQEVGGKRKQDEGHDQSLRPEPAWSSVTKMRVQYSPDGAVTTKYVDTITGKTESHP